MLLTGALHHYYYCPHTNSLNQIGAIFCIKILYACALRSCSLYGGEPPNDHCPWRNCRVSRNFRQSIARRVIIMSLRPGAVSFPEKWSGLQETISSVVQLKRVKMGDWNDHYSYPIQKSIKPRTQEQLSSLISNSHALYHNVVYLGV